jgi:hypothetical protein
MGIKLVKRNKNEEVSNKKYNMRVGAVGEG